MPAHSERKPPTPCSVPECGKPVVANGLCRMHDKRRRAGRPLVDTAPVVGTPSGFGQYGVLDDDGQTLLCHECGQRRRSVGTHIGPAHSMTAREYRRAHGIPAGWALQARTLSENRSALAAARVGTAAWQRLEAARDPVAAARSRDPDAFQRVGVDREALAARAVINGQQGRLGRVYCCPVCQALWCLLPDSRPRITCTPTCWSTWQAWSTTSHPIDGARRAAIYAEAHTLNQPRREVAQRWGITTQRVGQIVRTLSHNR